MGFLSRTKPVNFITTECEKRNMDLGNTLGNSLIYLTLEVVVSGSNCAVSCTDSN